LQDPKTCKELGKEPNKPYKGTFNIRISPDLHKEAAFFAASRNISLNDFIKTAIRYALSHRDDLNNRMNNGMA
jgi:predicted HicB family RNase H-like nuclease